MRALRSQQRARRVLAGLVEAMAAPPGGAHGLLGIVAVVEPGTIPQAPPEGGCGSRELDSLVREGWERARAGELEEASRLAERVLGDEPDCPGALRLDGLLMLSANLPQRAVASLERVAARLPRCPRCQHELGMACLRARRFREAEAAFRRALELEPGSRGTVNNLAWLLATAPDPSLRDGPGALALCREARLYQASPAWMDTLAAAQAECGFFRAARWTEELAWKRSKPPNPLFLERARAYERGLTYARWRQERRAQAERGGVNAGRRQGTDTQEGSPAHGTVPRGAREAAAGQGRPASSPDDT